MDIVALIGRILFAFIFIGSGVMHVTKADMMSGYAGSKGVPQAKLATIGSGVLMLVAGLMVLLGIWADLGALLLVVFLVPTALLMHTFWKETDPMAKQNEMAHFNKNMSLAGAALMVFALYSELGDELGITITGPLF